MQEIRVSQPNLRLQALLPLTPGKQKPASWAGLDYFSRMERVAAQPESELFLLGTPAWGTLDVA
jgi:hypothetical protein